MSEANVDRRLAALEAQLGRLEQLLVTVNDTDGDTDQWSWPVTVQ